MSQGQERAEYDPRRDPKVIKIMAQLMAQGAAMLEQTCPICGLPLFRLKSGDVVCPLHGKVYLVSSEEEAREVEIDDAIARVEYAAAVRAREEAAKVDMDVDQVSELLSIIEAAERIRRLRMERLRAQQEAAAAPAGRQQEAGGGKAGGKGGEEG